MTYLEAVPAGVLEEHRIVAGLVGHWALDVLRAGSLCDFRQPIDLAVALGPKGDPVLVGDVISGLGHSKEFGDFAVCGFVRHPTLDPRIARKAQGRQEHFIERSYVRESRCSQVDVIITSAHDL